MLRTMMTGDDAALQNAEHIMVLGKCAGLKLAYDMCMEKSRLYVLAGAKSEARAVATIAADLALLMPKIAQG